MSLFRKEVSKNQHDKLWGDVNLAQPLSYKVFFLLLVVMLITSTAFLTSSNYHKKQKVNGYLIPNQGIIKIFAPGSAYVSQMFVKEGQHLEAGQPMFKLEYRHRTASGDDLNNLQRNEIHQQLAIIQAQQNKLLLIYQKRAKEYEKRINNLNTQIQLHQLQAQQTQSRLKLAKKQLNRLDNLHADGFANKQMVENQQDLLLSLEQEISKFHLNQTRLELERQELNLTTERLPLELETELQKLQLNESKARARLTALTGQKEVIISASKSGRVTVLDVKEGQLLKPQQYMVSLLPEGAELYAELFIPTRAFGFIEEGQETKIKLEAFPYQKFGMLDANIFETSENILLPNEVTLPIRFTEPVYRVKAKLNKQGIQAYGKVMPLQAGMLLEAEILIDKRSLVEWLFEPLLSLRGILV